MRNGEVKILLWALNYEENNYKKRDIESLF
jgi:hypothetical protein